MENIKPIIEYNRKFLFDIVKNYLKIISTKFKKNLLKIIKLLINMINWIKRKYMDWKMERLYKRKLKS